MFSIYCLEALGQPFMDMSASPKVVELCIDCIDASQAHSHRVWNRYVPLT